MASEYDFTPKLVSELESQMEQMMKKLIIALIMLVMIALGSVTSYAAPAGENNTDQSQGDILDKYIAEEYKKMNIPAMSVQVVNGESTKFESNYGDCTQDTPFILGSISKSFTAVAIMQLKEQGKVDLDQPFAKYIPSANQNSKTTVKQLLHHTSGIHTYMTSDNYTSSDTEQGYEYCNVNYNLLGQIVENTSGLTYGEYIQRNIFNPLDMTRSFVSVEEARQNGLISGYTNYFGWNVKNCKIYPADMKKSWMSASSAYLVSTTNDMGKYLRMFLNDGQDILTKESIEEIFSDTIDVQEGYQYGYGWGIQKEEKATFYIHGGNVENYTTFMIILPEQNKAVITLTNACDFFGANDMIITTTFNIADKCIGLDSRDIDVNAYKSIHIQLNLAMLVVIISCILPLILFLVRGRKKQTGFTAFKVVGLVLVHIALPTFYLCVPTLLGGPLWVANRFAPDVFLVLVVASALLYLTGIWKLARMIQNRK